MRIQRITQILATIALFLFAIAAYLGLTELSTMSGAGILIALAVLGVMCVAAGVGFMIIEAALLQRMRDAVTHLVEERIDS